MSLQFKCHVGTGERMKKLVEILKKKGLNLSINFAQPYYLFVEHNVAMSDDCPRHYIGRNLPEILFSDAVQRATKYINVDKIYAKAEFDVNDGTYIVGNEIRQWTDTRPVEKNGKMLVFAGFVYPDETTDLPLISMRYYGRNSKGCLEAFLTNWVAVAIPESLIFREAI